MRNARTGEGVEETRTVCRSRLAGAFERHALGDGFTSTHHGARSVEADDDGTAFGRGTSFETLTVAAGVSPIQRVRMLLTCVPRDARSVSDAQRRSLS